jgi:hypothetical protein
MSFEWFKRKFQHQISATTPPQQARASTAMSTILAGGLAGRYAI